jgi:hypothetical protein
LSDARYRRRELEASLASRTNTYATRRLAHYASGDRDDWDRLPEMNLRTRAVLPRDLETEHGSESGFEIGDARAVVITDEARRGDPAALAAIGEDAFFRYPVELAPFAERALRSRADAERYGAWIDERRGVGGIVRVALPDGATTFAFTCSTCHAAAAPHGELVVGAGNARLDLGQLMIDAAADANPALFAPPAAIARWGPGRADVSSNDGSVPVLFPDLRPVRGLSSLHYEATVEQRSIDSLAIRIETLVITAHGEALRPPREIALGLARFLWSLDRTLPPAPSHRPRAFEERCARCHSGEFLTGDPVALDDVGTDRTAGESPERGTGAYRVPSLRGVGTRAALLHDGSLSTIDALFDPARTHSDWRGGRVGAGAVPGHDYGFDLDPSDRAEIVAYLRAL